MKTTNLKIEADFEFLTRAKRLIILILPVNFSVGLMTKKLNNSSERCALEATKFLMDTNALYYSHFYFLLPKFLKFVFNFGAINFPKKFLGNLIIALKTTRRHPEKRKEVCEQIYSETKELRYDEVSSSSWKLVSMALSGFGFIRAGSIARNNCLKSALAEINAGNASSRALHLAISGLLDSRRFNEATKCILKNYSVLKSDPRTQSYFYYLKLTGQFEHGFDIDNIQTEAFEDNLYSELIREKTVALVAPGFVGIEHGFDIDSHETVARVKHLGKESLQDPKFVGERCDINFLLDQLAASAISDRQENPNSHKHLDSIRLVITRKTRFNAANFPPNRPLIQIAPTFLTTATSGTMAIFDMLCQNPSKIKLFGFNFYIQRQQYNSAMLSLYDSEKFIKDNGLRKYEFDFRDTRRGSSIIASSRSNHDYLSDFLLIKNLYELSGLIDGTPEVLEILNLTADEYDLRLEEMLGDW